MIDMEGDRARAETTCRASVSSYGEHMTRQDPIRSATP
jgi:hypothetical protein